MVGNITYDFCHENLTIKISDFENTTFKSTENMFWINFI